MLTEENPNQRGQVTKSAVSDYINSVPNLQDTPFKYFAEYALPGHNAVTQFIIDGTGLMALFTDLGHLQQHLISQGQFASDLKGIQRYPLGGNIFGQLTRPEIKPLLLQLINTFQGQQADLPVPVPGMAVTLDSMSGDENHPGHILLGTTPFGTD
jgi:hypothetical protein